MRLISILLLGLGGVAILMALGLWQVRRLEWKTGILNDIEARIAAPAIDVPADPDPETDRYRPVRATGRTTGEELHVLVSTQRTGPGYRVIAPFVTDDSRRVMVDLGVVPTDAKTPLRPPADLAIEGNLAWPRETDRFTPAPERDRNIWFARDIPAMAEALSTEETLIVARSVDPAVPEAVTLPVGTEGIPNNHLQYAITWFAMAVLWAGMTVFALWRMPRH